MKKIIVIGSGYGGLCTSALLSKKGYQVTVLEKNSQPGGRAMVWKTKGFTFDMGPSFYQMPEVFDSFFKKFGRRTSDYYKLTRLNPSYRMVFKKDDVIDVSASLAENIRLFESIEKGAGKKLKEYLIQSEYQYKISMEQFLYKEYKTILDFFNWRLLNEGRRLHVFENMETYVSRYFKDDRLKKILEYTLVFLGGSPKSTPAIYSLMAHVDFNLGVWYPMGGMGRVTNALYENAKSEGVMFKFNTEVSKIKVGNDGKTTGVIAGGKFYEADIVVSNADYRHTEVNLLDVTHRSYPESYWEKRIMAPSAFIIYLGVNRKIRNLSHHTFFLENDWIKHFDEIFEKPGWPDKPSYYVCTPSKIDNAVAPKGSENLFILVPVASGLNDSNSIREKYYKKIISHLEAGIGESFQKDITVKRIFAHSDFKKVFNAYKGTALGMAHTLFQTAFFRPAHRSKKVKNLFFTGQYTHPGIGMPIQIISAEIVAEIIEKNDKH